MHARAGLEPDVRRRNVAARGANALACGSHYDSGGSQRFFGSMGLPRGRGGAIETQP